MSEERKQSVRDGLNRWCIWLQANSAHTSQQSSIASLYQEAVISKRGDAHYHYQTYNYECRSCDKQYTHRPLDRNNQPQNRCTRCGKPLTKVNEGVTGKKVFAGLIHETGKNMRDPVAEIYNAAIKSLPDLERKAVLWKYLSADDQKTYADKLEISVPQLQQALTKAYYYIMGYIDSRGERI